MTAAIVYALGVATGLVVAYCIVVFIAWRECRAESRRSLTGIPRTVLKRRTWK